MGCVLVYVVAAALYVKLPNTVATTFLIYSRENN